MKTKASFKGHPIHMMLIPFPIAFLLGRFAFDVLGVLLDNPSFWTAGAYLAIAGIVTGLAAAVSGFVDYLYSVPPGSSGKKRATWHMLVNVTSLGLSKSFHSKKQTVPRNPEMAMSFSETYQKAFRAVIT